MATTAVVTEEQKRRWQAAQQTAVVENVNDGYEDEEEDDDEESPRARFKTAVTKRPLSREQRLANIQNALLAIRGFHKDIPRQVFPAVPNDASSQLALKAKTLLGYEAYAKHLNIVGPLGSLLRYLNIEVLDKDTVKRYQHFVSAEARTAIRREGLSDRLESRWYHNSLDDYTSPVPEFALAMAIRIREAADKLWTRAEDTPDPDKPVETVQGAASETPADTPEPPVPNSGGPGDINFTVEEHKVGELPPDPFLRVNFGVERYYIAVWDEPGFEVMTITDPVSQ